MNLLLRVVALALATSTSVAAIAADAEWMSAVGAALGKTGSAMPGGVYRVGLARTDLKVTRDGVDIEPTLALGSWLAFTNTGRQGMRRQGCHHRRLRTYCERSQSSVESAPRQRH